MPEPAIVLWIIGAPLIFAIIDLIRTVSALRAPASAAGGTWSESLKIETARAGLGSRPMTMNSDTGAANVAPGAAAPLPAAALSALAFLIPFALSRSTTPTPDHPRVMLWYRGLRQPAFKPPDVVIPIAWTAIETGLAITAYRLLRQPRSPHRDRALLWWAGNIVGIGAWSRLFFGTRNLPASTVASAALGATAACYLNEVRKVDAPSTAASAPLLLWVGFATVLTAAIWRKNR